MCKKVTFKSKERVIFCNSTISVNPINKLKSFKPIKIFNKERTGNLKKNIIITKKKIKMNFNKKVEHIE